MTGVVAAVPSAARAGDATGGRQLDLGLLSARERQIFELLGQGLDKRHIAEQFGLSVKTVESHRESVKNKLGIRSVRELANSAVQMALKGAGRTKRTPVSRDKSDRLENSRLQEQYRIGASRAAAWMQTEAKRMLDAGQAPEVAINHLARCSRVALDWTAAPARADLLALLPPGAPWEWAPSELDSYIEKRNEEWNLA